MRSKSSLCAFNYVSSSGKFAVSSYSLFRIRFWSKSIYFVRLFHWDFTPKQCSIHFPDIPRNCWYTFAHLKRLLYFSKTFHTKSFHRLLCDCYDHLVSWTVEYFTFSIAWNQCTSGCRYRERSELRKSTFERSSWVCECFPRYFPLFFLGAKTVPSSFLTVTSADLLV